MPYRRRVVDDENARVLGRFGERRDRDEVSAILGDQYAIVGNCVRVHRCITRAVAEGVGVDYPYDVVTAGSQLLGQRMRAAVLIEQQAHDGGVVRRGVALRRLPPR